MKGTALLGAWYAVLMLFGTPIGAVELNELDGGVEASPDAPGALARGKYILRAAGCVTCHTAENTDAVPLSGGRELETEFGTVSSPNITPDSRTGIGQFTLDDFRRAVREGIAPNGTYYYPAFPYTSYKGMTDRDVDDLYAYLQSLTPIERDTQPHDLAFPYSIRSLLAPWRLLYFQNESIAPQRDGNATWNRGAYLVNALAHCGECHTPRNALGALDRERHLKGSSRLHGGPDITRTGDVGEWSRQDLVFFLQSGFFPDNDVVGSGMGAVVFDSLSTLTSSDIEAMVEYLRTVE